MTNANQPLIGISGVMGAGKDTLAEMIAMEYSDDKNSYMLDKFASALRRAVIVLTGITNTTTDADKAVDLSVRLRWRIASARGALSRTIQETTGTIATESQVDHFYSCLMITTREGECAFQPGMTVGRLLQLLGTECFRGGIDPEIWSKCLFHTWESRGRPPTVVADVRYPNESAAIRAHGGVVIQVRRATATRDDGREASHASEHALDGELPDIAVDNNGSLDDLRSALRAAWPQVLEVAAQRAAVSNTR